MVQDMSRCFVRLSPRLVTDAAQPTPSHSQPKADGLSRSDDDGVGAMGGKDNTRVAGFERPAAPVVERGEARR
jgi:hypothetical protein